MPSRATGTAALALAAAIGGLVFPAPGLGAPVGDALDLVDPPQALGDGRVAWFDQGRSAWRLRVARPSLAPRTIATGGRVADPGEYSVTVHESFSFAASDRLAAIGLYQGYGYKGVDVSGTSVVARGPIDGPLVREEACVIGLAASGPALAALTCDGRVAVEEAGRAPLALATGLPTSFDLAGRWLAVLAPGRDRRIEIVDRLGEQPVRAVQAPAEGRTSFALDEDGSLALLRPAATGCAIALVDPQGQERHLGPAACGTSVDVDGGLAGWTAPGGGSLVVARPGEPPRTIATGPPDSLRGPTIAVGRAAVAVSSCAGSTVQLVAAGEPPVSASTGACPVSLGRFTVRVGRDHRFRLPVRCPSGCRLTVEARAGKHVVARGDVEVLRGEAPTQLTVRRAARRLVRAGRPVGVRVKLTSPGVRSPPDPVRVVTARGTLRR